MAGDGDVRGADISAERSRLRAAEGEFFDDEHNSIGEIFRRNSPPTELVLENNMPLACSFSHFCVFSYLF
jgi:hypothetical protein